MRVYFLLFAFLLSLNAPGQNYLWNIIKQPLEDAFVVQDENKIVLLEKGKKGFRIDGRMISIDQEKHLATFYTGNSILLHWERNNAVFAQNILKTASSTNRNKVKEWVTTVYFPGFVSKEFSEKYFALAFTKDTLLLVSQPSVEKEKYSDAQVSRLKGLWLVDPDVGGKDKIISKITDEVLWEGENSEYRCMLSPSGQFLTVHGKKGGLKIVDIAGGTVISLSVTENTFSNIQLTDDMIISDAADNHPDKRMLTIWNLKGQLMYSGTHEGFTNFQLWENGSLYAFHRKENKLYNFILDSGGLTPNGSVTIDVDGMSLGKDCPYKVLFFERSSGPAVAFVPLTRCEEGKSAYYVRDIGSQNIMVFVTLFSDSDKPWYSVNGTLISASAIQSTGSCAEQQQKNLPSGTGLYRQPYNEFAIIDKWNCDKKTYTVISFRHLPAKKRFFQSRQSLSRKQVVYEEFAPDAFVKTFRKTDGRFSLCDKCEGTGIVEGSYSNIRGGYWSPVAGTNLEVKITEHAASTSTAWYLCAPCFGIGFKRLLR